MQSLRIGVVGAGAIGGLVAVRLAMSGLPVSVIVRGANLAAVRAQGGMTLIETDGAECFGPMRASDTAADLGKQDVIFLALKSHQVHGALHHIRHLVDTDTVIVTMQNGIPFWYFHKHGGAYEGRFVDAVDPAGATFQSIGVDRVIGSIVYPAAHIVRPGVIEHIEGNRFSLGEPDNTRSERVQLISSALSAAGFKAPVSADIRAEIWLKLWGNLIFNPLSALTHATLEEICRFPLTRDLARAAMTEAQNVAERLGVAFKIGIDRRIAGAEAVGAHKTSMLQDVEAGRELELEALVGAVLELGKLVDVPVTHIEAIYAATKLLNHVLQENKSRLSLALT